MAGTPSDAISDHGAFNCEEEAEDLHIPSGPITRSKAKRMQEALGTLITTFGDGINEAHKIMHVSACEEVQASLGAFNQGAIHASYCEEPKHLMEPIQDAINQQT